MEDKTKMVKDNEKLQEEVAVETPVVEEKPAEVEAPAEKIEEVAELNVETEQLAAQIESTKQELAVISEVREELVKLYADFKEAEQLKDSALTENEALKADVKLMSEQLNSYKVAEEKLAAEKHVLRLEQLSAKFRALGQEKTVEYLNGKDATTIREFENIVDAALTKFGDTAELPSLTASTQSESLSDKPSVEVKKEAPKVDAKAESLGKTDFFASVCNQLSGEQTGVGKKVKFM